MKSISIIGILIAGAVVGFLVKGMLPSGPPPGMGMPGMGAMPPPAVRVIEVALENTAPLSEYIARVEPIREVQLNAQVSGMIEQVHFTEGVQVKEGDLLFTIAPAEYEARVAQARAMLARAEATQDQADKYMKMLESADKRSVSQSGLDSAEANVAEAKAAVMQAQADLKLATINLDYTQIHAPISGRIGRALITKGNYVTPGDSTLAEIIQLDPVRVVFAMPDSEYLTLVEELGVEERSVGTARVRLPNGSVLPQTGARDFEDNRMNAGTGTIAVHLRFPNPDQLLVPDGYVSVMFRRHSGEERVVLPQAAIMRDGDGPFVWTVNAENVALQSRIILGAMRGQDRVVESGLEPGQQVVVSGLQKVRPGAPVALLP
jgi:RND family efflux transporter MFP subunit